MDDGDSWAKAGEKCSEVWCLRVRKRKVYPELRQVGSKLAPSAATRAPSECWPPCRHSRSTSGTCLCAWDDGVRHGAYSCGLRIPEFPPRRKLSRECCWAEPGKGAHTAGSWMYRQCSQECTVYLFSLFLPFQGPPGPYGNPGPPGPPGAKVSINYQCDLEEV